MDKKNKSPNVPNLRFSQFIEPWNNYIVSELLTTFPTNSLSWDQLVENQDSSLKNLHYGLIHNGFETTCISGENQLFPYIKHSFIPTKYALIQNGDLILADASEDRKDVGRPVEMLDIGNQKIVSGLHTIHARNKTDLIVNGFKGFYFQSSAMKQQIFKIANGSKIYGISSSAFSELKMFIPEKQEQKKIVDLMIKIEERIQTQSKIINDCMSYRNAIVDYFFESLSSDWKQVRLSNILNEYSELHIKDNSIVHATLSKNGIFPKTDRYDRDFLVKDEDKKYKVTHLDDICYNPANLKFGVITRNTFGDCIISPIYITFTIKNNCLPKFVELLVTRKHFIAKARKYEQGTVYERMSVNSSDLLSMYVLIPTLFIQKKIVNIIDIIDNKISNEQKLLNLYKTQKDYLLKNMFV
jgi:type I restriction enzyme S subunit